MVIDFKILPDSIFISCSIRSFTFSFYFSQIFFLVWITSLFVFQLRECVALERGNIRFRLRVNRVCVSGRRYAFIEIEKLCSWLFFFFWIFAVEVWGHSMNSILGHDDIVSGEQKSSKPLISLRLIYEFYLSSYWNLLH